MYHSISDDSKDPWSVSKILFKQEMDFLKRKRFNVITLDQAVDKLSKNESCYKCVVLTFDDGYSDFLDNAEPILSEKNFKATLFIPAGLAGAKSYWEPTEIQKSIMDWPDLKKVIKLGHSIGSHSLLHSNLINLSVENLKNEITKSKNILENNLEITVSSFSYPWGKFTDREIEAVKESGYSCAVVVGSQYGNVSETDLFKLEREIMSKDNSLKDFSNKVIGSKKFISELRKIIGVL